MMNIKAINATLKNEPPPASPVATAAPGIGAAAPTAGAAFAALM